LISRLIDDEGVGAEVAGIDGANCQAASGFWFGGIVQTRRTALECKADPWSAGGISSVSPNAVISRCSGVRLDE